MKKAEEKYMGGVDKYPRLREKSIRNFLQPR